MHPHTFYAAQFTPEKRDEVFVIMSFAAEFQERWTSIIEPTIRENLKLKANRVDSSKSGESVVHDILDGIAHARLVVAEITCSSLRDRSGTLWPQRNGNVMWELGVAHVMRMPDEVIVIRSDDEPSIFDLTQFRAFTYDPLDVGRSRHLISEIAKDRLRTIDQSQSDYVRRSAMSLDVISLIILFNACAQNAIDPPGMKSIADIVGNVHILPSIGRLLDIGALKTTFIKLTPDKLTQEGLKELDSGVGLFQYQPTALGRAIFDHAAQNLDICSPQIEPLLKQVMGSRNKKL